jgi:hypothetical protein
VSRLTRRGRAYRQLKVARGGVWRRTASVVPMALLVVGVGVAAVAGLGAGSPRATNPVQAAPAGAALLTGPDVRSLGLPTTIVWKATQPLDQSSLYAGPTTAAQAAAAASASQTVVQASSVHPAVAAPAGFRQQVEAAYADAVTESASAQSVNEGGTTLSAPAMPPTGEFDQALSTLTSDQVSELYDAFLKVPGGFAAFAAELEQAASATATPPAGAAQPTGSVEALGSAGSLSAHDSGTGNTFPQATTETTDAAGDEANCPASAPGGNDGDDGIYAATLAVDIATTAAAVVPQSLVLGAYVLGEGATFTIPDPVNIVTQVLIGAGQITRDTLIWLHQINSDCGNVAQEEQVNDIFDNVNSLVTLVDSRTTAIDNEEQLLYALVDSRNTLILNQIAAIQSSLNLELKVTIENDLLQGTSGAVADLEVPTAEGGYLNATPIGVQQLVTQALNEEQAAGQAVNPAAPEDLASANAALAAQNYKAAFNLYGQAYREIVGG